MLGTTFLLALKEIRRHLMRSFLTTLGVIIGVASVVTMVSLGNGATASIEAQISSLGTNLLTVRPGQGMGRGGGDSPAQFKEDDVDAVRTQIGGVEYVAPQTTASVTAIYEAQNWSTTVTGTTNDYFAASQLELAEGRIFSEAEETAGKSVCVIGETVRSSLFRDDEAIGRKIRLNDISCQVIGLLTKRGQSGFGLDPDDQVIMPIKTVMRRLTGNQDVIAFQVAVDPAYDSTAVSAAIAKLLRERRNLTSGSEDDFNILDSKQLSDTLSGTTRTLTLLLGAVAAVSLIVGGVGIMNIMLVSVTERTHEIGIRLAIGAVQREVLLQFLVEAVVLSCLGGIIGLILALIATIGLSSLFGLPFIFNVQINLLAFAFAALIGVVFGYFPARRAASLNPIDALRHE
ncbi:ABC transporter permease [Parasphingorhabdus sp.]|uniref:ABC transporter permease n=1 Tax=Parasphingorhabdus sp. TaxID=2709688 RepID=UPI003A916CF0